MERSAASITGMWQAPQLSPRATRLVGQVHGKRIYSGLSRFSSV